MLQKKVTDWTTEDFIQHECNLDLYERRLSGMQRLGEDITNPEMFRATDSIVKAHRARRHEYFDHFGIKPTVQ